jgi:glycosyltransferase involved in cell wall biosynthesis
MQRKYEEIDIILSAAQFLPYSFGGGEVYVYRLSKELLERGHRVMVLVKHPWNTGKGDYVVDNYTYKGIRVISISLNPKFIDAAERNIGFSPLTNDVLKRVLTQFRPNVVHINGLKTSLVNACDELKVPHLVTAHHMGIACPAGGLLRSDYSICDKPANYQNCVPCCCYLKAPKWYTGGFLGQIPSWMYRPIGKALNRVKNLPYLGRGLIYPWLIEQLIDSEKILLSQTKYFIAPSQAVEELLTRNGCEPSKITVLSHGIEPLGKSPFEPFFGRLVRFGYIGRIDPSKGLHILLKAMEILTLNGKLCELHIFGAARNPWDEEYRKKTLANYRGKGKILHHGLILPEKIKKAYQDIDVLVVPSILPEAFGLVVAEAFSAGRPVIVTNSGALQEQVRNGIDGFVVERNNSEALAEAMQGFIDNPDLITEMSRHILPVKTIEQHVDELLEVYHHVVQKT